MFYKSLSNEKQMLYQCLDKKQHNSTSESLST